MDSNPVAMSPDSLVRATPLSRARTDSWLVEIEYRCTICSPPRTDFLKPPEILYVISMMLKFYIGTDGDNLGKKKRKCLNRRVRED